VFTFLEFINVVKLYHWNTRSYSEHKATDELHDSLSKHIDKFVEVMLGNKRIPNIKKKIIGVLPQGPTPGIEEVIKEETKESVDKEERDEVYAKYKKETNMSHKELKAWSENKCSKKASLSTGPIKRNLELLSTKKESWTKKHITWANKTIAFNSRMRKMPKGKPVSKECKISKRDISLKNWAYDPNKGSKKKSYISIFERLGNEKVKASVKEVKMAMAVLLSLQESVDIPKKLKLGVYNQLAKVYKVLYKSYRSFAFRKAIRNKIVERRNRVFQLRNKINDLENVSSKKYDTYDYFS
jgi:hypothetical protein